jgi:hypothetical protein
VLGADGDVLPGSEDAGDDAGGEDAGGDDAGGEEAGGDDAGGEEAGGDDAGGEEAGGDDAGGEDAGGDDAGGEEAGGDDAGGEDAGDLAGLDDSVGCADDWDTTGVGGMDVLEDRDRAGLRYAFGETGADAEGEAEDDVRGPAAALPDAEAGAVATAPAPACGWRWLGAGVWLAPIRAKAATAEPATRPPVRMAEASVREIRCRPGPPAPPRGGGPERGG